MIFAHSPAWEMLLVLASPPQPPKSSPLPGAAPSTGPAPVPAAVCTHKARLFGKAAPAGRRHFPSDGRFCTEPGGSCRLGERGTGSGACPGPTPSLGPPQRRLRRGPWSGGLGEELLLSELWEIWGPGTVKLSL